MTDDEILEELRRVGRNCAAIQVAETLDVLADGGLNQGTLITYFKRAFPQIPLGVMLNAGGWSRVSGGGVSDKEFEDMLSPWLPTERGTYLGA